MNTFSIKANQVKKNWILIDAENLILGRLASVIATILRGKNKPEFTPSMDCGDNVIVINAEKVKVTGKKLEQSVFYWHTGYPGGLKEESLEKTLNGRFPERAIERAVQRMLPKNALGKKILSNLKVYKGSEHPHAGQNPTFLDVSKLNEKNVKRG
jgi:large subunit ribosomal protein L13